MKIFTNLYCFLPLSVKSLVDRIQASDIANRIANGAIWTLAGTIIAKFLVLLAGIFVAHILGKVCYGELGMIRSTITMFAVSASVGLGLTASKYIAEYRETNVLKMLNVCFLTSSFTLLVGCLLALLVVIFASDIATVSLNASHLTKDIQWGAIILFFIAFAGALSGILAGFEDFKAIAINTLIAGCFEFVFLIIGAFYNGVSGAIVGFGISYFVLSIAHVISILKSLKKRNIPLLFPKIKWLDIAIIWKFSLPATLGVILIMPVIWYVKTILVRHTGFGEMAVFDVSDQWKMLMLFIPSALSQIVLPILSNVYAKGNTEQYWKILKVNVVINIVITSVVSFGVIVMSKFILHIYGNDFDNNYPLILLAISTIFSSVCGVIGQAIASRDKMWIGFGFNLLWAGYVLFFSDFFINQGWGATGLALAILVSYILHTFGQVVYIVRWNKTTVIV